LVDKEAAKYKSKYIYILI